MRRTGIALLVRRIHNRLVARASPDAADVEKVAALATTAVEWTHDLCRSLSPSALADSVPVAGTLICPPLWLSTGLPYWSVRTPAAVEVKRPLRV